MATYYDGLNDFFKVTEQQRLASSAQLVYLHLLHLNNRSGNRGYVQVTDHTLGTMTSLSKDSITRAKRTLKNRGLIDFYTEPDKPHRGTTYSLNFFFNAGQSAGQSAGQTTGQSAGQSAGQTSRNNTISTNIYKEKEKEEDIDAGACENLDEILDYWEELCGGRLTFEHQSQLKAWVNQKGVEWVKEVMQTAADSNNNSHGISFNYLKAIVQNKLTGTSASSKDESKPAKTSVDDLLKALDEQIKW